MKLTEEQKQKINDYFESKSEEEVEEILKGYGLKEEHSYNMEELQGKIQDFKKYLFRMSHEHCRNIGVNFYWEFHEYSPYMFDNQLLTEINIDRI